MKHTKTWSFSFAAALLLAACGGGGDGDQSPRVHYSAMVSFGDSLSDVGTYATAVLKAATGGGKYTVNGASGKNWTELIAAQLGTGAPCAAQTGLESSGPLEAFAEDTENHANCYGYAQGGARVTAPFGPGNKALVALGDSGGYLGQLTDPVVNQINRHLTAVGGTFSGNELVTVLAGGNDALMNAAAVGAAQQTPTQAVTAMGVAGAELAGYINALIVGKGAKHVVVVNLPDLSQTPSTYAAEAVAPGTQALIQQMVITFNAQLTAGLASTPGVLLVDAYTQGQDQVAHPAQYGLTNVTTPACALSATVFNSLVCSTATLISGDVSHYEFADTVHPTPYGYQLLAQFVAKRMAEAGWL